MNRPTKLALAVALALGVAACGQKEEPKKAAAKPAAPAGVTVTIAHAGPLTGSIAHLGKDDENGVALAVEHANAKKLVIGGKPVTFKMVSEDDQADPKVGTTVAQKLVDAKVAAVIGHLNSGVTIPASEIYTKAGIPVISGSATNPTLTERGLKGVVPHRRPRRPAGPGHRRLHRRRAEGQEGRHRRRQDRLRRGPRQRGREGAQGAPRSRSSAASAPPTRKPTSRRSSPRSRAKNPDVVFHGGMDATGGPMLKQARELGIKAVFAFGDGACTDEMAQARRRGRRGPRLLAGGAAGRRPPARSSRTPSRRSSATSSSTRRTSTTAPWR